MAMQPPTTAPVLSTPDTHFLEFQDKTNLTIQTPDRLSDEEVFARYEVARTASELIAGKWTIIALQFPDSLLRDGTRVVELLRIELAKTPISFAVQDEPRSPPPCTELETSMNEISISNPVAAKPLSRRLYILGDTSYGSCCVDEIAAEHIDAEVVVHYGRACLSPTARLPVIYVFSQQPLSYEHVVAAWKEIYSTLDTKIILMADVVYNSHISALHSRLQEEGYISILAPGLIHDPSSLIPNRQLPAGLQSNPDLLKEYSIFHISLPPTSLLLTLSSRVGEITIFPTTSSSTSEQSITTKATTTSLLRRRYGILTSLSTTPIWGILINTLSVSRYSSAASNISAQIAAAGKKSYTFVVGKINAAKVANFAEIGGWVVVGCWESSLVEGHEFWKPVITPWELGIVLAGDKGRIWTGEWRGDFDGWVDQVQPLNPDPGEEDEEWSEDESSPPEFDLRTGQYVNTSRPMIIGASRSKKKINGAATALAKRANGDIARIGNEISPGAEYLRTQRTWRGLGSDMTIAYDEDEEEASTLISEGRSGIARGYINERV